MKLRRGARVSTAMHSLPLRWPSLAAGLLAFLLASCASDERPHRGPAKPPAPVAGEGTYFNGQIVASIRIGAEFRRPEGGADGESRGNRDGGPRRGGGMGLGGGGGGRHGGGMGGGMGGGPGGGMPPGDFGGGSGGPRVRPAGGGVPMMIHVQLRNTGSAEVEVAIPSFASPLGNFAVQPASLTIPAGASAEVNPMTSFVQGDLPDEMPATLVLRLAGRNEKQVIVLRPVPRDAAPPSGGPDPESRPTDK